MCWECNRSSVATSPKRKIAMVDQESPSFRMVSGRRVLVEQATLLANRFRSTRTQPPLLLVRCPQAFYSLPEVTSRLNSSCLSNSIPSNPGSRGSHFLSVIGRLRPGVTTAQALSEMTSLMAGWKSEARAQHLLSPPKSPGDYARSSRRRCRLSSQCSMAAYGRGWFCSADRVCERCNLIAGSRGSTSS